MTPTDPDDDLRERYRELLEELRTIIPGAQVLFAFLLTVPFGARFESVDATGKAMYTVALVGVALATIAFLTPAALHRSLPRDERTWRIQVGVRLTTLGMQILAASTALVIVVVVRFVYGGWLGWPLGILVGATAAGLWFLWPALHRRHGPR